ncbi:GPP34 family phosphoprotein [Actinotalea sp. K2]|uniref:GOLPH3/VPS74 family protein n=1 Tax=Actinotalea sp. K2 TaxID=2939438 RepID=UPI002017AE7D|nr:GPP34 family phosphoprotein [Actinotalea sp. K2]MCL3863160.1 GPP34 family phosphoprotein [Actinotalea sp. K2]
MILAEDVLLLLLDDVSGKAIVDTTRLDLALSGAVMLDLATRGRVDVTGPGEPVRAGLLVVRDLTPTGDTVLDEALRRIQVMGPKKPQSALSTLGKGLRPELLHRLTSRGVLRAEQGRILGVFPTRSWPAVDVAHERRLRDALHDVLVVGRTPTHDESALIALLQAVDQVPKVLREVGIPKRELRRRAKAVAAGGFAGEAVRKAVEAVAAATAASIAAVTAAGAAGS